MAEYNLNLGVNSPIALESGSYNISIEPFEYNNKLYTPSFTTPIEITDGVDNPQTISFTETPLTATVSFDGNGNTGGTVPADITQDIGSTITVPSSDITKTFYTFIGWLYGEWIYTAGETFELLEDTVLVAQWVLTEYTVTFNGNGYSSGTIPSSITQLEGTTVTVPSSSILKTNFTFGGWANGATVYQAGDTFELTEDVTLYAVWIIVYPNYYRNNLLELYFNDEQLVNTPVAYRIGYIANDYTLTDVTEQCTVEVLSPSNGVQIVNYQFIGNSNNVMSVYIKVTYNSIVQYFSFTLHMPIPLITNADIQNTFNNYLPKGVYSNEREELQ